MWHAWQLWLTVCSRVNKPENKFFTVIICYHSTFLCDKLDNLHVPAEIRTCLWNCLFNLDFVFAVLRFWAETHAPWILIYCLTNICPAIGVLLSQPFFVLLFSFSNYFTLFLVDSWWRPLGSVRHGVSFTYERSFGPVAVADI